MDERTTELYPPYTIYINIWTVSKQRHHWQLLLVHLWDYCTHPTYTHVNNVMWCVKVEHTTRVNIYTLGNFYVQQEPGKCKCCETWLTVFCPRPRRQESLTVCRCHFKHSSFFSVIFRPWVLAQPGFKPMSFRSGDWGNQAAVKDTAQR